MRGGWAARQEGEAEGTRGDLAVWGHSRGNLAGIGPFCSAEVCHASVYVLCAKCPAPTAHLPSLHPATIIIERI